MGKDWFQGNYRRNLLDMHISDWNDAFLSQYDLESYVDMLALAKAKIAMVCANSHVGLCYWPTETGEMHGGIKGSQR